jgi:hypothetical protein
VTLVYTASRTRTHCGRPDRQAPPAGSIYRLHLASCRYVQDHSTARPITFSVWIALVTHAAATDNYLLCKTCRPDEQAEQRTDE